MLFTFALPPSSHFEKGRSVHFARLFLLCMWLGHCCLSARHLDQMMIYVVGYNFFTLASAYLLFMTVIKRYGHVIRRRSFHLILAHMAVNQFATLFFYLVYDIVAAREMILLVSCSIPLIMTTLRIRHYIGNDSSGDRVIFVGMLCAQGILFLGSPLYLFNGAGSELRQTFIQFGLILVMMILFMLGFVVSVLHSLVRRLRSQVYIDPLTGCKNRHYFYDMAPKFGAHAARAGHDLSVVVCDIDHFKAINDKHGHVVGDKALKQFAKIVGAGLRKEDSLIRLGGEEFLILSPNCSLNQAYAMAERLRELVCEQPMRFKEASFTLTASFGVGAIAPKSDIFKGISEADGALYEAKSQGRNQVIAVGI
ncbi:GGDEF domain-containing protein [Alteromonas pelagimontana]|uniref:diguanylate cyclase n=1 Tax=Alteromonas pelagimontana TaxID=1858656 RepID=A0A6M4MAL9_9ALTE|nr:GGDEF domain-containing protein [Alteromonas pelagimontana]QJR80214.1 GGDEF domain-containing protein [Alteromonas pelagimontana]